MLAAVVLAFAPVSAVRAAVPGLHDDQLPRVSTDVESRVGLIEASGTGVVRVDVRWSTLAPVRPRRETNPADPAYRFERLDAIVTSLAARGITPLLTVYSTPRWAARTRAFGVSSAPRPVPFARFMQAVARRYSGRFVDIRHGTIPRVRHYELWNEPNSARFFKPQRRGKRTVSLGAYVAMVKAASARIAKVNPRAVVIAGSTAPRGLTNASGVSSRDWLRGIARGAATFDAYSMHIQSRTPPKKRGAPYQHWSSLRRILRDLDDVPRRVGIPVYITGAGYGTSTLTPARQALYLRQIFRLAPVRSERVPLVVWSSLQDSSRRANGLISLDGNEKSSFARFLGETRRARVLPQELRR